MRSKEKIKNDLDTNENKYRKHLNLWDTAKAILRGKFIALQATGLPQEARIISNKQPNPTPKN